MVIVDTNAHVLDANQAYCDMLGYTVEELRQFESFFDYTTEEYRDWQRKEIWEDQLLERGFSELYEKAYRRKDGTEVPIRARSYAARDENGNVKYIWGVVRDISEEKKAFAALEDREQRLELALQSADLGTWDWNVVTGEVLFDDRWLKMLGLDPLQTRGHVDVWRNLLHPEEVDEVLEAVRAHLEDRTPFYETEHRLRHADGHWVWTLDRGRVVQRDGNGAPLRMLGTHADISRRKEQSIALRESELRHREMFERHSAVMLLIDPEDGHILKANGSACDFYGYERETLQSMSVGDLNTLPPDKLRELMDRVAHRQESRFRLQHRLADGTTRDIEVHSSPITSGGRMLLYSIIHDVTAQSEAEAERERLLHAIEQAAEAIVITDTNGHILYVNRAFEEISGYTRGEVLGESPRILKSGEHPPEFYRAMWNTLESGHTWTGRMINRAKDGHCFTEDATISPVKDKDGKVINFVAVKRDITEEIKLEEKFHQAQKMDAVGQLTGGIAHDFNNLLQAINGFTAMAREDLDSTHPSQAWLKEVSDAGDRAARLVSQLLLFSRRQVFRPRALDLNEVVGNLLKMVSRVIGEHIQLRWHPGTHVGDIYGDRSMMEQVVLNLCVNARDAMPSGGTLTIETTVARIDGCRPRPDGSLPPPGSYALLTVSDTGHGMSDDVLAHIFEPFFTTKDPGKGTGLGLATVHGIVQQHKGLIDVHSTPGAGTTFELYFPLLPPEAPVPKAEDTQYRHIPHGTETILLAEDDAIVRKLATTILEGVGYTVVSCANGREALDHILEHPSRYDLVIMDLVMPVMGGQEAFERMSVVRPGLRVLFSSGYSEAAVSSSFFTNRRHTIIQKPFSRRDFLVAVRDTLDATPDP